MEMTSSPTEPQLLPGPLPDVQHSSLVLSIISPRWFLCFPTLYIKKIFNITPLSLGFVGLICSRRFFSRLT